MMQIGLIGFGAGATAALLFASVTTGAWPSVILFYLAPLPIMIAGIGWSHWAALIASLTAALSLGFAFGAMLFLAFLATAGLPAWWLSYLAMLARPAATAAANDNAGALEWYPTGRLVLWAAVLASLVVVVAIPTLGGSAEGFRTALHDALADILRAMTDTPADKPLAIPGIADPERLIRAFVLVLPPATAVIATVTNTANLWLAGRVVNFSGQLKRPWPQLSAITFPKLALVALAVAIGMTFVGGLAGIVATVLSAALLMAFSLLGFAVLHNITRGLNGRQFLLGAVYAAVLLLEWPVLAVCLIGLIDTLIDLRARLARRRQLPGIPHQP